MKDIKFRAWDKEKKIFNVPEGMELFELHTFFQNKKEIVCDGIKLKEHDYLTWQQYTGLKDKNGKEIYEGDIVKREGDIGVVRWDELTARFRAYMDNDKPMPRNYPLWSELLEVIGNIYEHRHLLNK